MSEGVVQNKKEPILAAIGSFIIPGAGQIYNGDSFIKGILILLGTTIGTLFLVIPGLIIWLYGIYDAYSVSKKINSGKIPNKEVPGINILLFIIVAIVWMVVWFVIITILLAAVIAAFIFGMGSSVQETHVVSFIAERTSDGSLTIVNEGGRDINKLKYVELSFVDASGATVGPDTIDNLSIYGVTGTLDSVGSSCTIDSKKCKNPTQIILRGIFNDGSTQVLLSGVI
jgi:TM2 domain-containing membrane protein YozV